MNTRYALWPLAWTLAALAPQIAVAQTSCEAIPENQIHNCSFETGDPPEFWTVPWGREYHREPDGHSGSYAASIAPAAPYISVWGFSLVSNCFPVSSGTDYQYGAYLRRSVSGGECEVRINSYQPAGCQGDSSVIQMPPVTPTPNQWVHIASAARLEGLSATLEITCIDTSFQPEFLVDDAYSAQTTSPVVIPTLSHLALFLLAFLLAVVATLRVGARGFERGGTSAWD